MTDLEKAIEKLISFGPPCEGSFHYHKAWKDLKEAYEKAQKEKQNVSG